MSNRKDLWDQSPYKDPLPYVKLPKDYKIPKPSEEEIEERSRPFKKKKTL